MSDLSECHRWRYQLVCTYVVIGTVLLVPNIQGAPAPGPSICTCRTGFVVSQPCTRFQDARCKECPDREYKVGTDESRYCEACDISCPAQGMEIIANCTNKNNLTCRCKENSVLVGDNPVCQCKKDFYLKSLSKDQWDFRCLPCPPGHHTSGPSLDHQCTKNSGSDTDSPPPHQRTPPPDVQKPTVKTNPVEPSASEQPVKPHKLSPTPESPCNTTGSALEDNSWIRSNWWLVLVIAALVIIVVILSVLLCRRGGCSCRSVSSQCCNKPYELTDSSDTKLMPASEQKEFGSGSVRVDIKTNGAVYHKRQEERDVKSAAGSETAPLGGAELEIIETGESTRPDVILEGQIEPLEGRAYAINGEEECLKPFKVLENIVDFVKDKLDTLNEAKPVTVAIVDSGLNVKHPDVEAFRGQIKDMINLVDDSDDISDVYGHGTAIFGIISEVMKKIPNAVEYVIIKAFTDEGKFTDTLLEQAMKRLLKNDMKDVSIVCVAGGFHGETSDRVKNAVHMLCQTKVLISAASNKGNRDTEQIAYPARASIAIGCSNSDGCRSSFSPQGRHLFALGMGENIKILNPHYREEKDIPDLVHSGTSHATAWVTAIAALCMLYTQDIPGSIEKLRKTCFFEKLLMKMCRDTKHTSECGYGPLMPEKIFNKDFEYAVNNAISHK